MEARLQVAPLKASAGLIRRYGVAILVTSLTLLASLAVRQVLEDAVPLVLFILAVMVSAWYGGLGPGVLASVLSVSAGNYFLMEPARAFALSSPSDWLRIGTFLVTAGVVSSLSEAMHEARRQAELQAREAEQGRRELEHALAERKQSAAERERLLRQLETELTGRRELEESLRRQTEALQEAGRRKAPVTQVSIIIWSSPWTWASFGSSCSRPENNTRRLSLPGLEKWKLGSI